MRNGKNILRMQADEEDVYHLMDLKELYFVLIGLGSFIEGIAVYFLLFKIRCWDLIYLCVVLFLGIFLLLRQSNKISKRIMEAEVCYMELDEFSLAVCQPEKNGHYECCRIFYEEIDKIVEGSHRGIPEFYIVLGENKNRESFFLLDEEEQAGRSFLSVRLDLTVRGLRSFTGSFAGMFLGKPGSLGQRTRRYGIFENQISKSAL